MKKILIVDDNPVNIEITVRMLHSMGYGTVTAKSGPEALEKMRRDREIGFVLMDIRMPEKDGYTAARDIRQLPPPAGRVPIVALSAYGGFDDYAKCRQAGINDFANKPLTRDKLKKIMDRWWVDGTRKRVKRVLIKRKRFGFGIQDQ